MTPFEDFIYLINHVLLGEEPTIEDFILLVGTLVAFIAFILWCCFPIQPKEPGQHRQFTCKIIQSHLKAFDAATSTEDNGTASASSSSSSSSSSCGSGSTSNGVPNGANSSSSNARYNSGGGGGGGGGSYSKNGTVAMHNYYVKNGHHCCT